MSSLKIAMSSNDRWMATLVPTMPVSGSVQVSDLLKRGLDLVVASLALVLLSPVLLLIAILVKRDGGSALFTQKRVGKDGKEFQLYKFRSMRPDADRLHQVLRELNQHGEAGVTFKIKHDPRITSVGRYLRKFSLDELPQLWNVVRGEMSLVGPRPALPSEVARYNAYQMGRLGVTPGLTCLWQVSGRADLPFETQVELDLRYIAQRSFLFDCELLLRTIPAVFLARGAY